MTPQQKLVSSKFDYDYLKLVAFIISVVLDETERAVNSWEGWLLRLGFWCCWYRKVWRCVGMFVAKFGGPREGGIAGSPKGKSPCRWANFKRAAICFFHFVLRFWNQVFICTSVRFSVFDSSNLLDTDRYLSAYKYIFTLEIVDEYIRLSHLFRILVEW